MCAGNARKPRVAVIGECLIELDSEPFGSLRQTFGGDTLNTALYLARIARELVSVSYISVMGVDILSEGIVDRWRREGIDTTRVMRDPQRLPGLYFISVDEHGERTFMYWRADSAARYLVQHAEFERISGELSSFDLVFFSGISLAILPSKDREVLIARLRGLANSGIAMAFDTNYRPVLWRDTKCARIAMEAVFPTLSLMLTSFEDEQRLWGDDSPNTTVARLHYAGVKTVVLKLGASGALYSEGTGVERIAATPTSSVVDTTAAGDSFNAGFIAGWLAGNEPSACCRAGAMLSSIVVEHRGAIIPAASTPVLSELFGRETARGRTP